MTLPIKKTERVQFEALLVRDRRGGGRVDAAAEQYHSLFAVHHLWARSLGAFHRITLFVPAGQAFVEDFHVAVVVFVHNAIGQTGQVMGACSIEHDGSIARNTLQIIFEFAKRRR